MPFDAQRGAVYEADLRLVLHVRKLVVSDLSGGTAHASNFNEGVGYILPVSR